ncbi:signal peptide protein [Streptomyces sp. NPDC050619]|uniref:signal peptide protein n=1 Tax=Streptomyces sp. NPDC050619 TaxID=3157214 RepID=UPI00341F67B3
MSSKNSRLRVAFVALVVGLAGLAAAGPAAAATHQDIPPAATAPGEQAPPVLVDFVDLAASPLPADSEKHEFTVTYRNESLVDQTVAPQLLVESPDAGPYLDPSDVKLERRTAHGCWKTVQMGTQTGTLYTDLVTAQRTLHPGQTLTRVYRLTVTNPEAVGTVQPRVALYA